MDSPVPIWFSLSNAILSFAGVLIGAAIAYFTQKSASRADRERLLTDYRLREYLATVDLANSSLVYMEQLGKAISGRIEPDENSSEEEKEEADRRDAEGAEAVEGLVASLPELRHQAYRVSIFGDHRVAATSKQLIKNIEEYFDIIAEEIAVDGIFRAKSFNEARGNLESSVSNLVNAIGIELRR